MKYYIACFFAILMWLCPVMCLGQGFRIVSYNVENLFDTIDNPTTDDDEFLPEGVRKWTSGRYYRKQTNIAKVLCGAGGWQGAALIGLQEVENDTVLDFLVHRGLRHYPYSYLHFDSPDNRGIDVALLYDTLRFLPLDVRPLLVPMPADERPTRDILYVSGVRIHGYEAAETTSGISPDDTLHIFVCHLPSQVGGAAQSANRRLRAVQVLREAIEPLLQANTDARIVVLGDMNAAPYDMLPPLTNLMCADSLFRAPHLRRAKLQGTEKYKTQWSTLDQILVSPSLLPSVSVGVYDAEWLLVPDKTYGGMKPRRAYSGPRFDAGGYSDHLPVYIDLQ